MHIQHTDRRIRNRKCEHIHTQLFSTEPAKKLKNFYLWNWVLDKKRQWNYKNTTNQQKKNSGNNNYETEKYQVRKEKLKPG